MRSLPGDPRLFQIVFLSSFLASGMLLYDVVPLWEPPLAVGAACLAQLCFARLFKAKDAGLRSALITGLGISLLLRSDLLFIPPLAATLAIASKFLIRIRGKHVFNPANFGLVTLMLTTDHAWVSPSQWGESGLLLAWFFLLGCAVVQRAFRTDVTIAFLIAWFALKTGRVFYLEQRPAVLFHQFQVASLIVFAFFMISDPKTTPDHRAGRIAFACLVAGLGFYLQASHWIQNGLVYALFALAPLTPILDRALKAARYHWIHNLTPSERTESCKDLAVSLSHSR